jgi:hypothetical protein
VRGPGGWAGPFRGFGVVAPFQVADTSASFYGGSRRGPRGGIAMADCVSTFEVPSPEVSKAAFARLPQRNGTRHGGVRHDHSSERGRRDTQAAVRLPKSDRIRRRGETSLGGNHPARAKRVDLLGHVSQERRDQETPHRGRPRQDARRNAQAVLLARLPAPVNPRMSPDRALQPTTSPRGLGFPRSPRSPGPAVGARSCCQHGPKRLEPGWAGHVWVDHWTPTERVP